MRKHAGMVQIYTGDGKGKTTASFGLALRAAGAGMRVCIFQFIKGLAANERRIFRNINNIRVEYCGRGRFIKGMPGAKDVYLAREGLAHIADIIATGIYDLVILDEVNVAMDIGLISKEDILKTIKNKNRKVYIVMTGRNCPKSMYKYADLITEMRNIKHPFDRGVKARKGIDF